MNSENFPEFLNDPSILYKVSYQELQSLVLEYPYASSLWKLLLCKAYFEDKSEFPKILEGLSIRIQDRRRLKSFMSILTKLKLEYDLAIETRQILDLEKLKEKAIERAMNQSIEKEDPHQKQQEAPNPQNEVRKSLLDELFNDEKEKDQNKDMATSDLEEPIQITTETPIETSSFALDLTIIENITSGNKITQQLKFQKEGIRRHMRKQKEAEERLDVSPSPKRNFTSWKNSQKPKKKKKKKKKNSKARTLAAKSVMYNTSIASETLAHILEQQGYFEKAIKMYEQLCLKNPEKIAFFEAKINNLKERR
jgi:hypothetical protein